MAISVEQERDPIPVWGEPAPTANNQPYIQDLVVRDIESRKQHGIQKYGTALQPFNGRNVLQDIYEEDLDRTMYARQAVEEMAQLQREFGVASLTDVRTRLEKLAHYESLEASGQFRRVIYGQTEDATAHVLLAVLKERNRQDAKWGEQNHDPVQWMNILAEEFGEASKEANKAYWPLVDAATQRYLPEIEAGQPVSADVQKHREQYRMEMIEVAAVAVAAVQSLDRNELGQG